MMSGPGADWIASINPPQRVVSLYPSMTRTLIDFKLADRLVGVTDFCELPVEYEGSIERVGGVKDPDLIKVENLQPDLVIANREENEQEWVENLRRSGFETWVTFPCSVDDAIEVMDDVARLFKMKDRLTKRVDEIRAAAALQKASCESRRPVRVFCPIWYEPKREVDEWWMTVGSCTYLDSVLEICGGSNIFTHRKRLYPIAADLGYAEPEEPAGRDVRYPRVTLEEIRRGDPELVLLPDEPYGFNDIHVEYLVSVLGNLDDESPRRIHVVDGRLLTWHGTMLAKTLADLPSYFDLRV